MLVICKRMSLDLNIRNTWLKATGWQDSGNDIWKNACEKLPTELILKLWKLIIPDVAEFLAFVEHKQKQIDAIRKCQNTKIKDCKNYGSDADQLSIPLMVEAKQKLWKDRKRYKEAHKILKRVLRRGIYATECTQRIGKGQVGRDKSESVGGLAKAVAQQSGSDFGRDRDSCGTRLFPPE